MKIYANIILAAALFLGLVPAPYAEENGGADPPFAEIRPSVINRQELTVVFSGSVPELDSRKSFIASEAQLFTALYEGLFSYHPLTMEPVSALAQSWQLSQDKKQWTFKLRAGAKYWNGDPVKSGDFKAAWISLLGPERESPYSSLFDIIENAREYRLGSITDPQKVGIETPDDSTLIVRLNSPAAFFPAMLCHHSFAPVHPSLVNNEDWSAAPPVSNGPFYITENRGNVLVMAKNPHYWDAGRVALNKLTVRFLDDVEDATARWNSGEARWIAGDIAYESLTDRSGIHVNAIFATHYYFIRSAKEPWSDHRLRTALSLSLPWEKIREGIYLPAKTLIYPIPGYPAVDGLDTTDLEQAKKLLSDAGYGGGKGLPELVILITPSREAERIAAMMASAWVQELGIRVKVDVVPFNQYFESLKSSNYDVGSTTWIGDFADPYTFLQMWRRDSNLNNAGYDDGDYETLMDRSMIEEGEARLKTLAEAEKMLLDRGTVLPISYSSALNIIDTAEIDGWFVNALDIHPFKHLSFKAFRPLPGVALQ
ncbi:MAG: peptide ABC transporter substrate-binding protein [Spirochaetaceae bacterium]|jgi:peptide/nickel transport system substrate-binding protein/oligopeptide transport system substrate-binding protein|nr:peptide ABC transporter substrate-binding protein [Spirochaetaceae bacterium]